MLSNILINIAYRMYGKYKYRIYMCKNMYVYRMYKNKHRHDAYFPIFKT